MSAWLGQWRLGAVALGDAANAIESITETLAVDGLAWWGLLGQLSASATRVAPALPMPGDPCGVPLPGVTQAVALTRTALLTFDDAGWHQVDCAHTVPMHSLGEAQRALALATTRAEEALSALPTIGSRSAADADLAALSATPLPPSMPARGQHALETAVRVTVAVNAALRDSTVPSSPSHDDRRIAILLDLRRAARDLMLASVTQ